MTATQILEKAYRMKRRVAGLHELPIRCWIIGYEFETTLLDKCNKFEIRDGTFLGFRYVVDQEDPKTLLIGTDGET